MTTALNTAGLDQIFLKARTHNVWRTQDVPDVLLRQLVDIVKMGPTSANCSPMRIIFVKSPEAKARLKPHLSEGNVEKAMAAPVTAILATDYNFYEHLPKLFPHADARSWFVGKKDHADTTAFRNASLQGGYFIIAARALGLDCGPMSGFSNAGVDKEFFSGGEVKSNFLCNLGHGDPAGLHPRSPRFAFDEIARIV
ncbi:MAG: malonic semialdehyde reductase [Hyphomicrobium sp.]